MIRKCGVPRDPLLPRPGIQRTTVEMEYKKRGKNNAIEKKKFSTVATCAKREYQKNDNNMMADSYISTKPCNVRNKGGCVKQNLFTITVFRYISTKRHNIGILLLKPNKDSKKQLHDNIALYHISSHKWEIMYATIHSEKLT